MSASATPSAIASARRAAIGRDGGAADPILAMLAVDAGGVGSIFGDAGLALQNPGSAAYGAPALTLGPGIGPGIGAYGAAPTPGLGALALGDVATSLSGAHTSGDDRVIASRRGGLRACYTRGRAANPDMSGKLKLHVAVGADGAATATTSSTTGTLSADTQQCMVRSIGGATFEPGNAHAFDVEITATLPK